MLVSTLAGDIRSGCVQLTPLSDSPSYDHDHHHRLRRPRHRLLLIPSRSIHPPTSHIQHRYTLSCHTAAPKASLYALNAPPPPYPLLAGRSPSLCRRNLFALLHRRRRTASKQLLIPTISTKPIHVGCGARRGQLQACLCMCHPLWLPRRSDASPESRRSQRCVCLLTL